MFCPTQPSAGMAGLVTGLVRQTESMTICHQQFTLQVNDCFRKIGLNVHAGYVEHEEDYGALLFAVGKLKRAKKICRFVHL